MYYPIVESQTINDMRLTKKTRKRLIILSAILGVLFLLYKLLLPGAVLDEVPNPIRDRATKDWAKDEGKVAATPTKNLYFGDLHVHSNLSMEAYFTGNENSPDSAYLFAKGNPIYVTGNRVQLKKPLDFMAVTDHSEFLGEISTYQNTSSPRHNLLLPLYVRSLRRRIKEQKNVGNYFRRLVYSPFVKPEHATTFEGFETTKTTWSKIINAAEKHYEPGKFTTFAAYEWTYGLIGHIHRNVIFKDMVVPDYPLSSFEARNEKALWESLQHFENNGSIVLAIPHNSNLSGGQMFTANMPDGSAITKDYADMRQKYERLVEVHQHKGNSEVYKDFWQNDEYADFENYYETELKKQSFVRDALKRGLEYEAKLGTNPFKYGMIGSTDTHNSTPGNTVENSGTPGNFAYSDATPKSRSESGWAISGERPPQKTYRAINPGGLVAVWAESNTRPHIYEALQNRETYATSGNRIQLRFYGGFDFDENYDNYKEMILAGRYKGTPMGSDLKIPSTVNRQPSTVPKPSFIIWAAKDPDAANLDRVQVIKGWYENGVLKEKIFNVIVSENGHEATVNLETGEWDTSKGATELQTVWTDTEFDANQHAFYYLRVLEVPTARWTLWDEILYGVQYPVEVPKTIQERAWSSPIWYRPSE